MPIPSRVLGYTVSVGAVLAVAVLLSVFYPETSVLTAATAELIVVLFVALRWGTGPALLASFLSAMYVNFYYVPPTLKFARLASGDDLVALIAYLFTSILVGQLSSRAQRKAKEVQTLYDQLREAFDRASQLEAFKQSERLKSALLDSVTHDLRTPLTSIKAAATGLRDMRTVSAESSQFPTAEDEMLSIIVQQSDRLNHFIQGMILLAKIQTEARNTSEVQAAPFEDVVGAALVRAEDALKSHHIQVECKENLKITSSPVVISQVLFALLENAGRYAPIGTQVRIGAIQRADEFVEVSVEDEGPGIPVELRRRVFEKFFRQDLSGNREPSQPVGLGLGLAIARGIVEAEGGSIWVEDRRDHKNGARFVFTVRARQNTQSNSNGTVLT